MALQVAIKLNDCVITSVFFSTPAKSKDTCSAEVPLTVAMA